MKRIIFKAILSLMVFVLFLTNFYSICIAQQNVVLSIFPKPKIDIILAKSRTKTDVSNFESGLRNALNGKNVDTSDVVIQAIDAQTVTDVSSFAWTKDVDENIGKITIENGGKDVNFIGNTTNPGKNAMWIIPNENQEQKFNFTYDIDFGDSFSAAGMLLRVKESGSNLTGYMLSFNTTDSDGIEWRNTASGKNGALWEFTYDKVNTTKIQKTLVQGIDIETSGNLTVSATDMEIKISGSGIQSPYTYTIPENKTSITGNGYGFFSEHFSHSCNDIGHFKLSNINLQSAVVKKFNEVLRLPDWRADAYKILVYVEDVQNEELQSNSAMGELLTRLLNEDIYFVGWGTSKNQTQLQNLIKSNNDKGKFINNTVYNTSLSETAQYIKDLINSIKSSNYLLVDEPISIQVSPPGIDKNTIDDNWKFGKWKVTHDYQYFENDMGQFADSEKYTDAMIKSFDKTGRYVITYEDSPITPQEIFVHRRPVAEINMKVNGTAVTLTSNSYDLDKRSISNGIAKEEWKYKSMDETNWHTGKLTTINTSKSYIVQLRVQDHQGEWSAPATKYITTDTNVLPIAIFNFGSEKISKYETLQITDGSYDPSGGTISAHEWELYKGKTKVAGPSSTPITDFRNRDIGEYTLYLTVVNNKQKRSEKFGKTFTVTNDEISPEFIATPTSQDTWKQSATVNLQFSDRGGSGFRGYTYAITDDQATPSKWNTEIKKTSDIITISQEGRKYLHVRGYDNDNNVSNDRVLGPFLVDHSNPTAKITADFSTITTNPLQVTIATTDTYSGVKSVTFNNTTLGNVNTNTVTIQTNGTYPLKVEDNAGNIHTENIVVNNIYRNCEAGLEHPIYSSDYNTCPICDLIQGLTVTNSEVIYDTQEKGVTYENPHSATIVEYYNGSTVKPKEVGDYNYELKVIYDNHEYQTGVTGTFSIKPQAVTIEGITATNRQYNSTTIVKIQGGTLVGINESDIDDVDFILPENGSIDNKDIGIYDVSIGEIVLTGTKAKNYTLIQPQKQDVNVEITPKDITIENILAVNRPYNGTSIVEIQGGVLIGVEEIDKEKVEFILPKTGSIDNIEIGTYNVSIDEIILTGDEAKNYHLIQPQKQDVSVQIISKEISIRDISATSRAYNGTTIVNIYGGKLVGLEDLDLENIGFILPKTGTIDNKDVGTYNVSIDEIVLTGDEAKNYQLIQPQKEDVTVEITQKEITIEDITSIDRQYDGTNIVQLQNGKLIGIEEIDNENVGFSLPPTGTISKRNVGKYRVAIADIVLTGDETKNYHLIQPSKDAVKVSISPRQITIEGVKGKDRKYDRTDVVEIEGGTLQNVIKGDDVKPIVPKKGTIPKDTIGQAEVTIKDIYLEGKDINNYKLIQPKKEDILVTISKPDSPKLCIKSFVSAINGKKDETEIRYNDEIQITIRIYNEGKGAGYAQNITNTIPEGLEFVNGNRINVENGWKKLNDNTYETNILNFEDITNEISVSSNDNEAYKDVLLVLKVTDDKGKITTAKDITKVEQVDIRNENIPFENNENEGMLEINISYTDFQIESQIKQISELDSNKQVENPIADTNKKLAKIEINKKKINSTKLKIVYQILIKNNGNSAGNIERIECSLPEGIHIDKVESNEWHALGNQIIGTNFNNLNPGTTEIKEITLEVMASQILGTKTTSTLLISSDDIDQIRILKNGQDNNALQKTNNYSKLETIVSISTGIKKIIIINAIIAFFITIFIVILFFKFKRK